MPPLSLVLGLRVLPSQAQQLRGAKVSWANLHPWAPTSSDLPAPLPSPELRNSLAPKSIKTEAFIEKCTGSDRDPLNRASVPKMNRSITTSDLGLILELISALLEAGADVNYSSSGPTPFQDLVSLRKKALKAGVIGHRDGKDVSIVDDQLSGLIWKFLQHGAYLCIRPEDNFTGKRCLHSPPCVLGTAVVKDDYGAVERCVVYKERSEGSVDEATGSL